MEHENSRPVPEGWGADHLSEFLETADQNRFATFVHASEAYLKLRQIDDLFMAPSTSVWRVVAQLSVSASLFHRCHGFYRTACSCAMAGQIAEAFAMCRAMLEAAGYAIHIAKNPGFDLVWINRHEQGGLKAVKKAFKITAVRKTIEGFNLASAERFSRLYQEAIDFGAHPNERSISSSLEITELGKENIIRSLLLNPASESHKYSMIAVARSGVVSLELLMEIFSARFDELGGQKLFEEACCGL